MIAVVADDFTGAGELGGIAIRYGLSAEIQTDNFTDTNADVIVIDSNTRSATAVAARERMQKIVQHLAGMNPEWIYKKTDSVMRGHIRIELECFMAGLHKNRALLVPANPSAGRIVTDGHYFINGEHLHHTDFSKDPEYPAATSRVLDLLGQSNGIPTRTQKCCTSPPENGITIGESTNPQDLKSWAMLHDNTILPAGGADFFRTILESKRLVQKCAFTKANVLHRKTVLGILGSSSEKSRETVSLCRQAGIHIFELSSRIRDNELGHDSMVIHCLNEIIPILESQKRLVIRVRQATPYDRLAGEKLGHVTATLVKEILQSVRIDEFLIEGGSTASTIVREMNWNRLNPYQELAPGVVRMHVIDYPGLSLTAKPGSYSWPENLWTS